MVLVFSIYEVKLNDPIHIRPSVQEILNGGIGGVRNTKLSHHRGITKITLNLLSVFKVLTNNYKMQLQQFNLSRMTMVTVIMANPLNTKQTVE